VARSRVDKERNAATNHGDGQQGEGDGDGSHGWSHGRGAQSTKTHERVRVCFGNNPGYVGRHVVPVARWSDAGRHPLAKEGE
jgi:hypothetical protein